MIKHGEVPRAVFFDVDGVLLDSLPQHLKFCEDKARQYGLTGLNVPTVDAFKRMINDGVRVSPMYDFFVAVGFPNDLAEQGVRDYDREFALAYQPDVFKGVDALIQSLDHAGVTLGIVTSNVRVNVEKPLGNLMRYFAPDCSFYYDTFPKPKAKSECLTIGADSLNIDPAQCCYVGDQPADGSAALAAGFRFIGVSYGWGFFVGDRRVYTVDLPAQIAETLGIRLVMRV
jgi:phosphoglycolate phosphatase